MILVVVVLTIATLGIVQFGVFFANGQQVALAARAGGLEASQTANLPISSTGPVPETIVSAVEHQLESSKIAWCKIRLEHNVTPGGDVVVLNSPTSDACDCRTEDELPQSPGAATAITRYVRLTVCVPLSEVFPEQLSFFGEQLFGQDQTYEHTAVFQYELDPPP
jgi:hypothetical protein